MLIQPKNIAVFERFHVLSPVECRSRYEIMLENYAKTINIEANTMLEMANKQILPALIGFAGDTAAAYNELMCAGVSNATSLRLAQALSDAVDEIYAEAQELQAVLDQIHKSCIGDALCEAKGYRDQILPQMEKLRQAVDKAEGICSSEAWPMPSYTDLLHRV